MSKLNAGEQTQEVVETVETVVTEVVENNESKLLQSKVLVLPKTRTIFGEILEISQRDVNSNATTIVIVQEIGTFTKPVAVFVSDSFIEESAKGIALFVGNNIAVTLEEHLPFVTGYYGKTNGVKDSFLTPHEKPSTTAADASSIYPLSAMQLRLLFKQVGLDKDEIAESLEAIKVLRDEHAESLESKTSTGFRGIK